jgi:hypothetical protein
VNPTLSHSCKHAPADDEHRCGCGRLVAKRVPGGVELRCGRCKKPIVILFEDEKDHPSGPEPSAPGADAAAVVAARRA